AQRYRLRIRIPHFSGRMLRVRGRGVQVELRRLVRRGAQKAHVKPTTTDVQRLLVADLEGLVVNHDGPRASDVDDAELAALEEVFRLEGIDRLQRQRRVGGDGAAGDETVVVRVDEMDLTAREEVLDQEFPPKLLRVEGADGIGVGSVSRL